MPQMSPYTLELQFVSLIVILGILVVGLAYYVIPGLVRHFIARTYLAVTSTNLPR